MNLIVEKPKTWKGLSYVLKTSVLEKALIEAGLDCYVQLVYWTPKQDHKTHCSIIEAHYWYPNNNVPYYRFYIRAGVVPSNERENVEALLSNEVLPKLIQWMQRRVNEDLNSTKRSTYFSASYINGRLVM